MVTVRPWLQCLWLQVLEPGNIRPSLNCQCSSAFMGLKYLQTYSSDTKGPQSDIRDFLV